MLSTYHPSYWISSSLSSRKRISTSLLTNVDKSSEACRYAVGSATPFAQAGSEPMSKRAISAQVPPLSAETSTMQKSNPCSVSQIWS